MGCYDEVVFQCPDCGGEIAFQSKGGDCSMLRYKPHAVPLAVAGGLDGSSSCSECGATYCVEVPGAISVRLEGR